MAGEEYKINGHIIDRGTGEGISGLHVEAWDREWIRIEEKRTESDDRDESSLEDDLTDDFLGKATSNQQGEFSISFNRPAFAEVTELSSGPDVYFIISHGDTIIKNTENSIHWNLKTGTTEVIIKVDASKIPPHIPSIPSEIKVTPGDGQVELRWNEVRTAESYNIYWSTNPDISLETGTPIEGVHTSPYVHDNLTNGTTYWYVITAVDEEGESAASEQISTTPKVEKTVPNPPSNIIASAEDTLVELQWEEVSNADSYVLYWSTNAGFSVETANRISDVQSPFEHKELDNGTTYSYQLTALNEAGESDSSERITATPKKGDVIAPPLNPNIPSTMNQEAEFLFSAENPIQKEVEKDVIESRRVAVLRGRVQTHTGTPLSGVKVTVHGHNEFGYTRTRNDGLFDMAVNGGGQLTVEYKMDGYLPVQRSITVPWQDYSWLPDVVLMPMDEQVTTIDLTADEIQIAQSNPVSDEAGKRQPTLLFQPETTGSEDRLDVQITEYTVGENGPAAMPHELPPTSGYTYAVEFTAGGDETADSKFDPPVVHYVENFLDFPVGEIVPVGYFDRNKSEWIPSDNGLIIKTLEIVDGLAELDIDGSGQHANADTLRSLGVTDKERRQLAELYQSGQSLWRVPIPHFSPFDCNWPWGPPPDARLPDQTPQPNDPTNNPC